MTHRKRLKANQVRRTVEGALNALPALLDTKTRPSTRIACATNQSGVFWQFEALCDREYMFTDASRVRLYNYSHRLGLGRTFLTFWTFLVEYATLASRECAESGPSISMLCTWFR